MNEEERKQKVFVLKLNLLFSLYFGMDQLFRDLESQATEEAKSMIHEEKKAFNYGMERMKAAHAWFEKAFEEDSLRGFENNWEGYDILRYQGGEQMMLLLMAMDRTRDNNENYENLFQFLMDMKGGMDILNDEDINRFYLKLD